MRHTTRRGFSIIDLVFCLATLVAVLAVGMSMGAGPVKRAMRISADLKFQAEGAALYASDFQNAVVGYSWRLGDRLSDWDDLNDGNSDVQVVADQMVDILRRRTGRHDLQRITGILPQDNFYHLPLLDYLDVEIPNSWLISEDDILRQMWADDPEGFDNCEYEPSPGCGGTSYRWPYSTSYQQGVAFWSFDRELGGKMQAIRQWHHHFSWLVPQDALTTRFFDEVAFPDRKVYVFDRATRRNEPRWHADPEAVIPMVFADGHVTHTRTSDTDPGWDPRNPDRPTIYVYSPRDWEPQAERATVAGHYRFTRDGLSGIDLIK